MTTTPVRVCYVVSYFYPFESGAERQARLQGAELSRRGHVVHAVTKSMPGHPSDETIEGIRVHRWIRTSAIGPLFGISFVTGVIRALRRLRAEYDIIHTHQGLWEAIATGLGRDWLRGAPVLVQPASSGYYGEAEELARTRGFGALRRLAIRNPYFAAISADIARQWQALGVPAERIFRTASGVDANHFRPGPSALESELPARPRVVYTGRLHPQKNLDRLLAACPAVVEKTRASLILIGWGPDRERLENQAEKLGVTPFVKFIGPINDPAEYLRGADAFVLPSVAEGMSNSLLEAMASGLPCLASAIGGNTDLIDHEQSGLLLPPADSSAWTEALVRVLSDPSFAHALGRAARQRVEAEFALPVVVDRYIELYQRLLADYGSR
jgi:glycosyltransferase involved in cell wall biosynthesis